MADNELVPDKDCVALDALDFQVGAVANVTGYWASEWPDPVRIVGIEKYRGKLNITIESLEGGDPTDGFGINELLPVPRHRIQGHTASGDVVEAMVAAGKEWERATNALASLNQEIAALASKDTPAEPLDISECAEPECWKHGEREPCPKCVPAPSDDVREAVHFLRQYADYIKNVPSAELERHPYLPALEETIAALSKQEGKQ